MSNASIPQSVKDQSFQLVMDNVAATSTQVVVDAPQSPVASSTDEETGQETGQASAPAPLPIVVKPEVDSIESGPYTSSSTIAVTVGGEGFNSTVNVKVHGDNGDLMFPNDSVSEDGTSFDFTLPANFPADNYVVYVYQDGVKVSQRWGSLDLVNQ